MKPIDDTTRTRIAALPGIISASLDHDGRLLHVEYDLQETELQTWLSQACDCGVQPAAGQWVRIRRWLAAWREHNRRRHLLTPAGWHQYLQSAFLVAGGRHTRMENTASRKNRQRYLNEDGRRMTATS